MALWRAYQQALASHPWKVQVLTAGLAAAGRPHLAPGKRRVGVDLPRSPPALRPITGPGLPEVQQRGNGWLSTSVLIEAPRPEPTDVFSCTTKGRRSPLQAGVFLGGLAQSSDHRRGSRSPVSANLTDAGHGLWLPRARAWSRGEDTEQTARQNQPDGPFWVGKDRVYPALIKAATSLASQRCDCLHSIHSLPH
ncbi:protein Mpv17 isoform X5 [Tachyglossus aculeatus]|uniref:protein Mpv17 isoform X5 n=1 Tax=Tachyglossus aculeatus TaxID=9261 RepID=UPI0018F4C0CA|nr:protein Mpv17 isoform X5 [Tachyglossus aculeatus]